MNALLNAEPALFQRAPTLGGECYLYIACEHRRDSKRDCFNGHPPLGVNAIKIQAKREEALAEIVSMGTHPWG